MSRTRDEALSLLQKFSTYASANRGGAEVLLSMMKHQLSQAPVGAGSNPAPVGKRRGRKPGSKVAKPAANGPAPIAQAKPTGRRGRPPGAKNKVKGPHDIAASGVNASTQSSPDPKSSQSHQADPAKLHNQMAGARGDRLD